MKKISTLLTGLILATGLASAEQVTVSVLNYDDEEIAKSFTTELTKNDDGSWTLADFFNSDNPASFKFEIPARGKYAQITMCGNIKRDDSDPDYPWLMTTAGKYMTCNAYDLDGDGVTPIYYAYVCEQYEGTPYSYVYRYSEDDEADGGYAYYACINVAGFDENNDYSEDYYLCFDFNEPSDESGDEGDDNKDEVVYLFNTDFENGQDIFNGWGGDATREVVDGALVIDNPKAEAEFYSVQVAYDFPEPLTEGTVYTLKLKVKGSVASASDFSAGFQVKSSYAGAGDFGAIPLTTEYKELSFETTCTNGEGDRFLFSLGKYVGKIFIEEVSLSYPKSDAINAIEVVDNSDAPVEFYNLQGVKVNIDNAANGIYIRRQGSEVKKVLIRK